MQTFSDKDGKTIAHVNLSYDPESPVLTATLTADARVYVNGIAPETDGYVVDNLDNDGMSELAIGPFLGMNSMEN